MPTRTEPRKANDGVYGGALASVAARADGRVVQPTAWEKRSQRIRGAWCALVQMSHDSWAQRGPPRLLAAAPVSLWANAARRLAADEREPAAGRRVQVPAVKEQQLAAVVQVRAQLERAKQVLVRAKRVLVQARVVLTRVVQVPMELAPAKLVLEPGELARAKLVPAAEPEAEFPAAAEELHSPRDPAVPDAMAPSGQSGLSADQSDGGVDRTDQSGARAWHPRSSKPKPKRKTVGVEKVLITIKLSHLDIKVLPISAATSCWWFLCGVGGLVLSLCSVAGDCSSRRRG